MTTNRRFLISFSCIQKECTLLNYLYQTISILN